MSGFEKTDLLLGIPQAEEEAKLVHLVNYLPQITHCLLLHSLYIPSSHKHFSSKNVLKCQAVDPNSRNPHPSPHYGLCCPTHKM